MKGEGRKNYTPSLMVHRSYGLMVLGNRIIKGKEQKSVLLCVGTSRPCALRTGAAAPQKGQGVKKQGAEAPSHCREVACLQPTVTPVAARHTRGHVAGPPSTADLCSFRKSLTLPFLK